jgi:hypothetical protein
VAVQEPDFFVWSKGAARLRADRPNSTPDMEHSYMTCSQILPKTLQLSRPEFIVNFVALIRCRWLHGSPWSVYPCAT